MPLISWTDKLSVSNKTFDNHHKKLISLINDLFDARMAGKGREIIDLIFEELVNYTKYHFSEEEKIMLQHKYPALLSHKKEHADFVKKVIELDKNRQNGSLTISTEVGAFLKDWLTNHIMKTDKAYSEFFKSKGIS